MGSGTIRGSVKTVQQSTPAFTVANGASVTVDAFCSVTGYDGYFLNYIEYRSVKGWYVRVKNSAANHVTLDIVNETGSEMSVTNGKCEWLLIPK